MGSKGQSTTNSNFSQQMAQSGQSQTLQQQAYNPFGASWLTQALQAGQPGILGTVGTAQPYYNAAAQMYGASAGTPNVSAYFNPYAAAVTNQLNNIFGQQQSAVTGQLTQAAGGVGADRIAVGQSELANQQGLAAGQTMAGLYGPALQAAQQQQALYQGAGAGFANIGTAAQAAAMSPYLAEGALTSATAPALGGQATGASNTAAQMAGTASGNQTSTTNTNNKGGLLNWLSGGGNSGAAGLANLGSGLMSIMGLSEGGAVNNNPYASGGAVGNASGELPNHPDNPYARGAGRHDGRAMEWEERRADRERVAMARGGYALGGMPGFGSMMGGHSGFMHPMHMKNPFSAAMHMPHFDDGGSVGDDLSFEDRAAPVRGAIISGVFDPEGANATTFDPSNTVTGDVPLPRPRPADADVALPDQSTPDQTNPYTSLPATQSPPTAPTNPYAGAAQPAGAPNFLSGIAGNIHRGLNQIAMGGAEAANIDMEAKKLAQAAEFHRDEYNKLTAAERLTAMKPVPIGQDAWGRTTYGQVDPQTGQVTPIGAAGAGADMNGAPAMPPQMHSVAQAIAGYQQPPLSGFAMSRPAGAGIMSEVYAINPDYRADMYGERAKAVKDFGSGQQGNTIRSFDVATQHLNLLQQLGQALNNGNVQAINQISNAWATQTGQAAPTNFEAARDIVADEVVKAVVGSRGALGDRESAASKISAAQSWPQLIGAINTYKGLMAGQLTGLAKQYADTTGLKNFNDRLSPDTQREILNHQASAPAGGFTGRTAINKKTGQRLRETTDGQWVP